MDAEGSSPAAVIEVDIARTGEDISSGVAVGYRGAGIAKALLFTQLTSTLPQLSAWDRAHSVLASG